MAVVRTKPRYSAMIPIENKTIPEKKEIKITSDVQPCTGIESVVFCQTTMHVVAKLNSIDKNPNRDTNRKGVLLDVKIRRMK